MNDSLAEDKLFKALGHPTRRKILRYIGKHGEASYTELSMIEPKSGVLYHHLRILGDLVYQDKNKLYKLTDKGYKALEFLDSFFLEPKESSIHTFLTPRKFFERIEDIRTEFAVIAVFLASTFFWINTNDHILVFLLYVPMSTSSLLLPPVAVAIISWFFSSILLLGLTKYVYNRGGSFFQLLSLTAIPFTLMDLIPLFYQITENYIARLVVFVVIQLYSMLLVIAALSVVARISLRRSGLLVITLHYISIIIYIALTFLNI
ncbi:MAG: hypothetical protein ACP6IP_10035 [Candidatus Njordarchaeia archaeon]